MGNNRLYIPQPGMQGPGAPPPLNDDQVRILLAMDILKFVPEDEVTHELRAHAVALVLSFLHPAAATA